MPIYSPGNSWGGNSISKLLFDYLVETLPKGKTLLELGSGWGSAKLMQHWNVISIEDDPIWFKKYNPNSLLVPRLGRGKWYDPAIMAACLKGLEYDLLLVDGPWSGRDGMIPNLKLFNHSVPIVFDDVRREEGRGIAETISNILDRPLSILGSRQSMFGVIK